MKKTLLIFMITVFILSSCKKDTVEPETKTVYLQSSNGDKKVTYFNSSGIDSNGWTYLDVNIPFGTKVDSIYCDFDRPGYLISEEDCIIGYSLGTTYNPNTATGPISYQSYNKSMYHCWIVTPNFNGQGKCNVILPSCAGAIWHSVIIAYSNN